MNQIKLFVFLFVTLGLLSNTIQAGNIAFSSVKPSTNNNVAYINSKVWNDINKNGIMDANENGISGVSIVLINNENGNVVAETITDANGNYDFAKVIPGNYMISFSTPNGYEISPAIENSINQPTSKNLGGVTEIFNLAAGQFVTDLYSGFHTESTLGFNQK